MLDMLFLIEELRRKREAEEAEAKLQPPRPTYEEEMRAQIAAYDLWMAPVGRPN
jgi:hypothetical protein